MHLSVEEMRKTDERPRGRNTAGVATADSTSAALTPDLVRQLARHCLRYRDANDAAAVWQLLSTFALFAATAGVLLWGVSRGYLAVLLLAIPAGGLLVRLFIIQHDCGHGSFFTNKTANTWVGRILSVLTLTPYDFWRRAHARHHASAGDLSRRGIGDVDTLTVREYRARSAWAKARYRAYRHPAVLHLIGPPLYFILLQRLPFLQALPVRETWRSVMGLNAAILLFYGTFAVLVGPWTVLAVVIPVACVASWVGGWLFFVQHQFEDTRWDEGELWNFETGALGGSSYYVLPRVLQWFTGNVGLHHIHHLNSRIPNYRLQACLDAEPRLAELSRLTLRESLSCIGLALWDEDRRKLVSFAEASARAPAVTPAHGVQPAAVRMT